VGSCGKPDATGSLVDTSGWVKCPHPKCTEVYTAQLMIDNKADAAATEALEKLRTMAHGYKEAAAAKAQLLEEIRLEDERIQSIKDGDEREAHILKKRIIDDILSLKCPRCRAVFSDFDGCFALT
jgi:phage FluMu protein Com